MELQNRCWSRIKVENTLQLNGGGLVPLSSAICCRPCLPDELPGPTEQEALAVVSIGCHATSGACCRPHFPHVCKDGMSENAKQKYSWLYRAGLGSAFDTFASFLNTKSGEYLENLTTDALSLFAGKLTDGGVSLLLH